MQETEDRKIAEHIFTGSIAMVGICLTVITLFSISKTSVTTVADEILAINAFLFIISSLLSYSALRSNKNNLHRFADILFFFGMVIMVLAGALIVFFP